MVIFDIGITEVIIIPNMVMNDSVNLDSVITDKPASVLEAA